MAQKITVITYLEKARELAQQELKDLDREWRDYCPRLENSNPAEVREKILKIQEMKRNGFNVNEHTDKVVQIQIVLQDLEMLIFFEKRKMNENQ